MIGQPQLQILVADPSEAANHPEQAVIQKMLRMLNSGGVDSNGIWNSQEIAKCLPTPSLKFTPISSADAGPISSADAGLSFVETNRIPCPCGIYKKAPGGTGTIDPNGVWLNTYRQRNGVRDQN